VPVISACHSLMARTISDYQSNLAQWLTFAAKINTFKGRTLQPLFFVPIGLKGDGTNFLFVVFLGKGRANVEYVELEYSLN
jgi:hypothetical protein